MVAGGACTPAATAAISSRRFQYSGGGREGSFSAMTSLVTDMVGECPLCVVRCTFSPRTRRSMLPLEPIGTFISMEPLDDIDRKMIDALRADGRRTAPMLAD